MTVRVQRWRPAVALLLATALAACSTPAVELTATAAPTRTPLVTPTPAPTAIPLTISKVSVTESVAGGDKATAIISTASGASCTIEVTYDSGPSQAAGLEATTSDASGKATWSWTVGRNTKAGEWPIEVACFKGERDGTLSFTFRVR